MSTEFRRAFKLHSDALPENTLEVVSFDGIEKISQIFRFELELVSHRVDIDFDAVLTQKAWLGLRQPITLAGGERGTQTLKIHGVFSQFEQLEHGPEWVRYRAVLVPELWRLSLGFQSQIHLGKTVPQVVEAEVGEATTKYGFPSPISIEVHCSETHPEWEYMVQYLESDLNFIQRRCEHEGVFYFFRHEDAVSKAIFADTPGHFSPIVGMATIPYHPSGRYGEAREARAWHDPEEVLRLSCRQNVHPSKIVLQDYNWRTPSTPLLVELPFDNKAAFATFYEFGNHYKDGAEGNNLARIRSEEIKCRKRVFTGASNAKAFRAGYKFRLSQHYRADFNQEYLLLEVRHRGRQPVDTGSGSANATYENEFVAIPATAPYRPERTTPKPRVHGVFSAKIDASGSGDYAEIDQHGRYKVCIPFDLSGRQSGTASRWIRMAQPYSGRGMGMHFPLHKGTEVLLIHANGDPDRPLIVGSVPNPETASPIQDTRHTQSRIHTGGGNAIAIEDCAGSQRITLYSPTGRTIFGIGAPPA